MNKPVKIIYNPIAGKGKALSLLPTVKNIMEDKGILFDLEMTERAGHGIEIAKASCQGGYSAVIAAGGDGTMNEVLNGLMTSKEGGLSIPKMGVLCVGRGNDFAYGADIPTDLEETCELIRNSNSRKMDVGKVTGGDYPQGRFFGNGIGVGFDTIVGLEAAKMTHVHGFMAYVFGALKTLITYPAPPKVEVKYNGKLNIFVSPQISVMNGKRMGGTFFMAPKSKNNDSLMDLCLADNMKRLDLLKTIVQYTKGTQEHNPHIVMDRAEGYEISALEGVLICHADGETICTDGKFLRVECLPGQIDIICNTCVGDGADAVGGKNC